MPIQDAVVGAGVPVDVHPDGMLPSQKKQLPVKANAVRALISTAEHFCSSDEKTYRAHQTRLIFSYQSDGEGKTFSFHCPHC